MTTPITGFPNFPAAAPGAGRINPGSTESEGGFGSALKQAIEQVDQLSSDSHHQAKELLQGDRQEVHNVMISVEKADVAFQLMMQVRNKIVSAYQEISRMQF